MRKTIYTAVAFSLMVFASMAFAQPGPGGHGGPGSGGPGNGGPGNGGAGMVAPSGGLIEYLGLDDAQLQAWNAYHEEFGTTIEPMHETMQELHAQLREAVAADAPNATLVGQLMLDIEAVRAQVFAARGVLETNLKSILTADQLIKFEAFRAAQAQMRRGAGGPGGGPGQGHGFGSGQGAGCGAGPGNCDGPCS